MLQAAALGGAAAIAHVPSVLAGGMPGSWHSEQQQPQLTRRVANATKKLAGAGVIQRSCPTFFDVDGDGKDEIIIGTTRQYGTGENFDQEGRIYVFRPDNDITVFWSTALPENGGVYGSIAVGRLFGNSSTPYLVVPIGGQNQYTTVQGGVACYGYNAQTKAFDFVWKFHTKDEYWPSQGQSGYADPVITTPLLVDVNNDGNLEIFFGSWDHNYYLLDANGNQLWSYHAADTVWSSAAAADVNGDGFPEIICGQDITKNNAAPDGPENFSGGWMNCFDRTGKLLWRKAATSPIYSSPALADIDGDGELEVLFQTNGKIEDTPVGVDVFCLKASNGAEKWKRSYTGTGFASVAIGDLRRVKNPDTGRSYLQVVAAIGRETVDGVNDSRVILFDHLGNEIWNVRPVNETGDTFVLDYSPILADYNGDGRVEIIQPMGFNFAIVGEAGNMVDLLQVDFPITNSAAIGDPDRDGQLEIYAGASKLPETDSAWMFRWDFNVPPSVAQPWPMFRHDPLRTGRLLTEGPADINVQVPATPGSSTLVKAAGIGHPTGFSVQVSDGTFTPAGAARPQAASWLTVKQLAETLNTTAMPVISISLNDANLTGFGVYTATVEIVPDDPSVTVTPRRIAVTANVAPGPVLDKQTFVPLTGR